jgi:hypothetical protein
MRRSILVLLALLAMAHTAAANPKPEDEARALNRKGVELLDQRDFIGALEAFRAAYARFPSVKILLNIGTASRNLGRYAEAAEAYERYLSDPAADPQKKPEVTDLLQKLDLGLGRLRLDIDPADARCFLDGKPVSGRLVRIEPGTHALVAEKGGFVTMNQTVTVAAREERNVQLHLAPQASDEPAQPPTPPPAPAPTVSAPPPPIAEPPPSDDGSHRRKLLMWSLGGAGVVLIGAGAYFGLSAHSDWNDVSAHCPNRFCTDPMYLTRADDASHEATLSTFFVLTGVTAGAAAAILWWRQPSGEPNHAVRVIPLAGSGFGGAMIEGTLP